MTNRLRHDFPISEGGFFRQPKDPIGKPATPLYKTLFQTIGPLVRSDLLDTESDLGDCHGWQRQFRIEPNQPSHDSFAWSLP
jgi:hypothetical protein